MDWRVHVGAAMLRRGEFGRGIEIAFACHAEMFELVNEGRLGRPIDRGCVEGVRQIHDFDVLIEPAAKLELLMQMTAGITAQTTVPIANAADLSLSTTTATPPRLGSNHRPRLTNHHVRACPGTLPTAPFISALTRTSGAYHPITCAAITTAA